MGTRTWRVAMQQALYGEGGFYHRPEGGPGHHFRTSTSASVHFARAIVRLLDKVDEGLGRPPLIELVEVAAARGALLSAVAAVVREEAPMVAPRLRLAGVELADRPASLPAEIAWHRELADRGPVTGLLLANEWLDNVPLDVAVMTADGPRLVIVDEQGTESTGPPAPDAESQWLERWWPLTDEGDRAEIGLPRDEAWAAAVSHLEAGLAVAIDYGHMRAERGASAYAGGTLTGYRDGRQVFPVPDGSCDITAHVALDAVAAAGAIVAGARAYLMDQRAMLRDLGVTGDLPDRALASADPRGYLSALQAAGQAAELIARGGLGDFVWVVQPVGVEVPPQFWLAQRPPWDDAGEPTGPTRG